MPIYMLFEGVDGPHQRKGGKWISLESIQLVVHGKGPHPGRDILMTKDRDVASAALVRESLGGTGKRVVIEFVGLTPTGKEEAPWMTVVLENTLIVSYSADRWEGSVGTPESLTLNCARITSEANAPGKLTDADLRRERAEWELAETW